MNYFELFGLEQRPVADKAAASKKYFELQKKYHPDFYTNESEEEKEMALEQSAAVNKAYLTFQNPDKTIEYFLQLKGIITPDEKYQLPPDFLMEMMELNESFDEPGTDTTQRAASFETDLKNELSSLLQATQDGTYSDIQLQQMKAYHYKKKYLNRILERLDD